jgi:hypothetical protein
LTDFQELRAEVREHRHRIRLRFRDHGHANSINRSYEMSARSGARAPGCSVGYVWETGQLFLKTQEALESDAILRVGPFSPERLRPVNAAA